MGAECKVLSIEILTFLEGFGSDHAPKKHPVWVLPVRPKNNTTVGWIPRTSKKTGGGAFSKVATSLKKENDGVSWPGEDSQRRGSKDTLEREAVETLPNSWLGPEPALLVDVEPRDF